MSFSIDASEIYEWAEGMGKVPGLMKTEIPKTMSAVAQHSANTAAAAAPVDWGILKAGIVALPGKWIGSGAESAFVSTAPYSHFVEHGRAAIPYKKGRVLRFQTKDGRVLYRRSVGPSKPQPFMAKGTYWARKNMARMVSEKVRKVLASR